MRGHATPTLDTGLIEPDAARTNRKVALWLFILCGLIYAMVVLGGVTRLTGSGLSMVDWRPVTGILPPMTDDAWQAAFDSYRESPEYRAVNAHMSVADFKGIFWLEYLHRLLGRLIGLAFLVPFAYFLWRGYIARRELPKYALMFVLGGLQGVLGWYMVKSGLVDNPRVSQYRLTAHLVSAFVIYAYIFWIAMSLLARRTASGPHPLFGRAVLLTGLIALTIISGGFVAGLDAGLVYNTFPKMGGYWIPPGLYALEPAWLNLFENMATAQFNHRVLAVATFCAVVAYWWFARRSEPPAGVKPGLDLLLLAAMLQVALGISTLLAGVPVVLAATHQAVALLLFTVALYLGHRTRHP